MLKLENVSKRRNSFRLENISFELPKGYIMGLIGENGAGKTTLLNILSGLYAMDSGAMFFDEKPYSGDEESIRQEIGVIVHGELFEGNQSLLGNARRYGQFYVNYDQTLLKSYGARFGLDLRKKYKRLSKGEKLKFALAFALSHQPKLLLLDEPTANFDQDFRKEFQEILRDCIKTGESSVILSTHIMSDIDKFADYLLMLKKGRQVLSGDIESVREDYRMVAGEAYKIKLLKDRVVHMEEGKFGCKALVKNSGRAFDKRLKVWEPTAEELMYYITKGDGL